MRKIDKSKILSNEYKEWLDELGDNDHPPYSSSSFKYYHDIKMSLLHCQGGLCAYTEQPLCPEKFIDKKNWNKKEYEKELTKNDKHCIKGDLEHFDESLKPKKAWLLDNLFIVDAHVNRNIKKSKRINSILKPDSKDYDPYKYLESGFETDVFFPNINLTNKEIEDVEYMIKILGLNCIINKRKRQLEFFKLEQECRDDATPNEYLTAWDMSLKKNFD